jgi:hypothetical protein
MSTTGIQILSFENFNAFEAHLRLLKGKYNDAINRYEETLGFVLRDNKPVAQKSQNQQRWAEEMQQALTVSDPKNRSMSAKDDNKKMFGSKDKDKRDGSIGEWVALEPMSVFVGQKNKGLAELYFDAINMLRENMGRITLALSICQAVKAKAALSGNTSLVVSFVNDIPNKVLLRPSDASLAKKYTMSFSFAVPSMPPAPQSVK